MASGERHGVTFGCVPLPRVPRASASGGDLPLAMELTEAREDKDRGFEMRVKL